MSLGPQTVSVGSNIPGLFRGGGLYFLTGKEYEVLGGQRMPFILGFLLCFPSRSRSLSTDPRLYRERLGMSHRPHSIWIAINSEEERWYRALQQIRNQCEISPARMSIYIQATLTRYNMRIIVFVSLRQDPRTCLLGQDVCCGVVS